MTDRAEIRRIQEEELKALKAIYIDELEDCRENKGSKAKWKPVEVKIKVKPHGDEVHVSCSLHICCGPNYPDTTPQELNVVDCRGLSDSLKQELLDKLRVIAYKSKGSEVIYSLIDCTRDFLTDHNEPSPTSFYDQMVSNRRKIAEEEEKKRLIEINMAKLRDETTSKHIQEEIQRKQMVLRQESRLRRESFIDDIMPPSPRKTPYFPFDDNQNSQPPCLGHKTTRLKMELYKENKEFCILRGNCVLHDNWNNSIHYIAMNEDLGLNCLLTEWVASWKDIEISPATVYNLFKSCEKEITQSVMSLKHSNLIIPLSFGFSMEKERSYLRLLNPLVNGCRLCELPSLMKGDKLDESYIKRMMNDVLEGLIYLHKQDIIHGDLRDTVIIIDFRDSLCKLANFFVDAKIRNLQFTLTSHSSESKSSETEDTDIYRFGLILLWLSTGWPNTFTHLCSMTCAELVSNYLSSYDLSMEVSDLISKCLRANIFNDTEEIRSHSFFYQPGRSRSNTETRSPLQHSSRRPHSSPVVDIKDEESEKSSKQLLSSLMVSSETLGSRLTDYEILSILGCGGFGEVYKVRNKLDQCYYALKKIPIKASNVNINRKIIHEVKYLSRLNHENVVRYYGTWIETENREKRNDSIESDLTTEATVIRKSQPSDGIKDSSDEESSDEDYSDHELFSSSHLNFQQPSLSENYIVYEREPGDETPQDSPSESKEKLDVTKSKSEKQPRYNHVMYIQMELCEKNTLRNAIDSSGLANNPSRRRRLFREIVEGLVHIHEHHIIHRDLKPGNIFLDSRDHVKIGDFGLATKAEFVLSGDVVDSLESISGGLGSGGSFQSGLVGTFLYMAPELKFKKAAGSKITYTQKVDIYSLGIILFEMCYPPTETKSERIKVLSDLREPEIKLPPDADQCLSNEEVSLLKVLLHHDVNERPTSTELLNSPYLPPPQIEEEEQKNVIREVVNNPQSKTYHYLLNLLFNQESDVVDDVVYDFNEEVSHRDECKRAFADPVIKQRAFQFVTTTLTNVFQRYGAIRFSVPTYMPSLSAQYYKTNDVFRVMDATGSVICPPYDLRVPFARYIARNRISNFRRYSIEKVYRGRKMSYHPKEIYECAFDIVSAKLNQNATIIAQFEIINLLNDILHEFSCLKNKSFVLRLNNVDLLRGLLYYYEVPDEKHSLAMEIIAESIDKSLKFTSHSRDVCEDEGTTPITILSKSYLCKRFRKEDITKTSRLNNLMKILEQEKESVEDLKTCLNLYLRKKQPHHLKGIELINQSIEEMEKVVNNLVTCNNNLVVKLKFSPIMLSRYYSGLIFQLEEETTQRKNFRNIIAIGGQYDKLVKEFTIPTNNDEDKTGSVAVGLSLGVEQITRFVVEDEVKLSTNSAGICDIVIYLSENDSNLIRDMNRITKELRACGIRAIPYGEDSFDSVDQLHVYCEENRVKYSIVLNRIKENTNQKDVIGVRIFHIDKERRIIEKKCGRMTIAELVDTIKVFIGFRDSSNFQSLNDGSHQRSDSSARTVSQSDSSGTIHVNASNFTSLLSSINLRFFPIENKFMINHKKRFSAQINSLLTSTLASFSVFNNSTIEVFALDLPFKIVKSIVADIEFGDSNNQTINRLTFEQSCKQIVDKHPKHRSYLRDVLEVIYSYRLERQSTLLTLVAYNQMQLIIFT
ncbi:eIF-2-alpha kinase GCN2-like [Tetranychus urticae]|uniref:non-specific serine/threonine protein kinase n=1 Tax=Tetranychus urticae TaxID=32264 RepID=T1KXT5_TETUR|nr:eIF-2-alpha kinase GCN2-like [Tetranychus urticae]